jgi:hypothetical protein
VRFKESDELGQKVRVGKKKSQAVIHGSHVNPCLAGSSKAGAIAVLREGSSDAFSAKQ